MAANKARQSVKQLANKGDVKSARILAREVVRSNRQKDRLSVSKARLGSIGTQLSQQMGEQLMLLVMSQFFLVLCSNGQGDRFTTKIHGDHEAIKRSH